MKKDLFFFIVFLFYFLSFSASGEERLLAGQGGDLSLFGYKIHVPSRDRTYTNAFTFLLSATDPTLLSPNPLPVGAFYLNRWDKNWRYRAILTGVSNEIYGGKSLGGPWEWIFSEENFTLPLATGEYLDGREVKESELFTGFIRIGTGLGLKFHQPPFQEENRFTLALLYRFGYFYYQKTSHTASFYKPHPDTVEHSFWLRLRYDGFLRNLLELRHKGISLGADIRAGLWQNTRKHGFLGQEQSLPSYIQYQAYFLGALPLSSHLVGLLNLYGGYSPNPLDRNTAFSLGGSSSADETGALASPILWGAHLAEFKAKWYSLGSIELRWEVLFFLFLHFRLLIGRFKYRSKVNRQIPFYQKTNTGAISFGLTTGFLWDSVLVFDYAYNWEIKRRGHRGSHFFILRWSKPF